MSNNVLVIQDGEFEEQVLSTTGHTLVYFWAPWCGPCRLMAPAVEWAAQEYSDRLKVVKMEVDPNPESVAKCDVQGVPALILFQDGKQVDAIEGALVKPKLQAFLQPHL
jgi:thioredoxin 1